MLDLLLEVHQVRKLAGEAAEALEERISLRELSWLLFLVQDFLHVSLHVRLGSCRHFLLRCSGLDCHLSRGSHGDWLSGSQDHLGRGYGLGLHHCRYWGGSLLNKLRHLRNGLDLGLLLRHRSGSLNLHGSGSCHNDSLLLRGLDRLLDDLRLLNRHGCGCHLRLRDYLLLNWLGHLSRLCLLRGSSLLHLNRLCRLCDRSLL